MHHEPGKAPKGVGGSRAWSARAVSVRNNQCFQTVVVKQTATVVDEPRRLQGRQKSLPPPWARARTSSNAVDAGGRTREKQYSATYPWNI